MLGEEGMQKGNAAGPQAEELGHFRIKTNQTGIQKARIHLSISENSTPTQPLWTLGLFWPLVP